LDPCFFLEVLHPLEVNAALYTCANMCTMYIYMCVCNMTYIYTFYIEAQSMYIYIYTYMHNIHNKGSMYVWCLQHHFLKLFAGVWP
jgi:hypothetical protein